MRGRAAFVAILILTTGFGAGAGAMRAAPLLPQKPARLGAIEGRLTDTAGNPLRDIRVRALRRIKIGRFVKVTTTGRGAATTNDLGEYRIFDLRQGDYLVVADQNRNRRESDDEVRWGTAMTWFPGSTRMEEARVVHVDEGRDTTIDFTPLRSRLATVTIAVTDSRGAPAPEDASLSVRRRSTIYADVDMDTGTNRTRTADGRFVLRDVPVGDYVLGVHTFDGRPEGAYAEVTIGPQDTTLEIQTNTGATVSGRVILNGRPAGTADVAHLNAHVAAFAPPDSFGSSHFDSKIVDVKNTDRFTLTGLRGPVRLYGNAAVGEALSITHEGKELSGRTLVLSGTERIEDVVVEVTTKTAFAKVKVLGAAPRPGGEPVTVLMFPDEPSSWPGGSVRYSHTVSLSPIAADTANSGANLIRMAPGAYRVIAFPRMELSISSDPTLLAELRPLATPVTLVAGDNEPITIGVTELPK